MKKNNSKLFCVISLLCVFVWNFNFVPIAAADVMQDLNTIGQQTKLSSAGVKDVLENFLTWALGIFGIIAVLAFVISGIMYLTAAGNTTQIEKAKTAMKWSIVGIVIGLGGVILIQTINSILGG